VRWWTEDSLSGEPEPSGKLARSMFLSRETVAAASFPGIDSYVKKLHKMPGVQISGGMTARLAIDPARMAPAKLADEDPKWEGYIFRYFANNAIDEADAGSSSSGSAPLSKSHGGCILETFVSEYAAKLPKSAIARSEKKRMAAAAKTKSGAATTSLSKQRSYMADKGGDARTRTARGALRRWEAFRHWYQNSALQPLRRWHLRVRLSLAILRARALYSAVCTLKAVGPLKYFSRGASLPNAVSFFSSLAPAASKAPTRRTKRKSKAKSPPDPDPSEMHVHMLEAKQILSSGSFAAASELPDDRIRVADWAKSAFRESKLDSIQDLPCYPTADNPRLQTGAPSAPGTSVARALTSSGPAATAAEDCTQSLVMSSESRRAVVHACEAEIFYSDAEYAETVAKLCKAAGELHSWQ